MPRIAFLFRTDVHASERNPASWKGDYAGEIWSSLEQIGKLAREYSVDAVLDGGDYFHIKAASRNPHGLVEKTVRIHRDYPCPVLSIEGNHDIAYNNLSSISHQPLGVLYASETFRCLRDEVFRAEGLQVRVVGMPYSPFRTLEELQAIKKQPGDTHLIAVVHQLAGYDPPPNIDDFFGEPVFDYRDLANPDGPDVYLFGHWHKDQGCLEVDGVQFVNYGAVSRGALVKENLERVPKVALIEVASASGGILVTPLPLHVLDAAEVFDLGRKARQDAESTDITKFVEQLQESLAGGSETSIEASVGGLDFAREVRDTALTYLERAREMR